MDGTGLDPTAARAQAGHVRRTWWATTRRWLAAGARHTAATARAAPDWLRRNLPMAIMAGVWAGVFTWEVINTTDGFRRAFPEREWWQVAFVGVACPLGFMIAYRVAAEAFRNRNTPTAIGFSAVAVIMFAITGFFTFSNFVGETQLTGQAAREINEDRQALRDTIRRLDREWVSMPEPLSLQADQELLKSRLAEAEGWGMANLDPEGACKADLKQRQRFLCNDAATIRDDIIRGEAMLNAKQAKRVEIDEAERRLDQMQIEEAGAQYEAMAAMTSGRVSAEFLSSWILLIVSIAFLVADAAFGDYLLERREKKGPG